MNNEIVLTPKVWSGKMKLPFYWSKTLYELKREYDKAMSRAIAKQVEATMLKAKGKE